MAGDEGRDRIGQLIVEFGSGSGEAHQRGKSNVLAVRHRHGRAIAEGFMINGQVGLWRPESIATCRADN
jgi:hypothetical protein